MSSERFHIEIEVDNLDTPERKEAVVEAIKIAARQAYVSCLMIVGENPKPVIVVWGENMMDGRSNVSLQEQEDSDD